MIPLPWRAIAAAAGVLVLLALGWTVNGWRIAAGERDEAKRQAAQVAEALTKQLRDSHAAEEGYLDELETLRNRRAPAPVVRLCERPRLRPTPAAPAGVDAGAPAPGELPPEAGPDIGPELYGAADAADEIVAQCRALQAWARSIK